MAGLALDSTVMVLLLTPIFVPIITQVGMDPVHFGILMMSIVTLGGMTWPSGSAMFAVCSLMNVSIEEYSIESIPFIAAVGRSDRCAALCARPRASGCRASPLAADDAVGAACSGSDPIPSEIDMKQTWRWFGPHDLTSIDDIIQSGAEGVVSALHHIPNGEVWTPEEIALRQRQIGTRKDGSPSGLRWDVVESLPISEDIKQQTGDWRLHIANYQTSLRHLAEAGLEVICYNFMPVLDWTRTALRWRLAHGGTCMRFELNDFAAFDIHILERKGAGGRLPRDCGRGSGPALCRYERCPIKSPSPAA